MIPEVMKRLIFLGIFAAFLFTFLSGPTTVLSQEIDLSPSLVPTATPTPIPQKVDYQLPYPGLLPDNPLYTFKAVRDKVIEFLISDPAKKAEFYLLASDKRVNTGYYLILKNQDDMGVLYISKSNNYLSMAEGQARLAKERGAGVMQTIKASIRKHAEVIDQAKPKLDKKNRTKLKYEIDRLEKLQSLIEKK